MITFHCKNCGQKINVQDKFSGKKGKCPKCGSVVAVPEKSTVIEFHCESCGQKISVPQVHAGKKGRCPNCKNIIVVPGLKRVPTKPAGMISFACTMCDEAIEAPDSLRGKLIECRHCGSYAEVPTEEIPAEKPKAPVQTPREDEAADKRLEEPQRPKGEVAVEETEPAGKRKLPWLIDILLYPTSSTGLLTVGGFAIVLVVPAFLIFIFRLCCMARFTHFIIVIVVLLYVYWYFCECIRDSAAGGFRAPEILRGGVDWGEVAWTSLRLLACYIFFFGPVTLYAYTRSSQREVNSVVLWSLLTYGVFFYPMAILAVAMFESVRGLNPILIFRSIVSTFLPYCGLLVLSFGLSVLFRIGGIGSLSPLRGVTGDSLLSPFLFTLFIHADFVWLLLAHGHLLGRFYWRYEEKLNWGL